MRRIAKFVEARRFAAPSVFSFFVLNTCAVTPTQTATGWKTLRGNLGSVHSIVFSPDGKLPASGGGEIGSDGKISIFSVLGM